MEMRGEFSDYLSLYVFGNIIRSDRLLLEPGLYYLKIDITHE
jgi:hypothetical protein